MPVIAQLISDDPRLGGHLTRISKVEWQRAQELARKAWRDHPELQRDGRPGFSGLPARGLEEAEGADADVDAFPSFRKVFVSGGLYHFFPKPVGFRQDYCRSCEHETLSVLLRTFDVYQRYRIPLIPLGWWSRWYCASCGRRPREVARMRGWFKISLAVLLVPITAMRWLNILPMGIPGDVLWFFRIVASLGLVLTGWSIALHRPERDYAGAVSAVAPYVGMTCPLCGGQLLLGRSPVPCADCGAEHRPLQRLMG